MSDEHLEIVNDVLDLDCDYKGIDTDEDGSFEGYASVFGNKDLGNDVSQSRSIGSSVLC